MKKVLIVFIFFNIYNYNIAQINNASLTYWYYRDRLRYFVVPGEKQGESEVMDIRNRLRGPDPIGGISYSTFGQQNEHLGLYIGTLATEYKLLKNNNEDYSRTEDELKWALDQFDNYLDKNSYYGDNNNLNGFFVRENIPCDFLSRTSDAGKTKDGKYHFDLLNEDLQSFNHWNTNTLQFDGLDLGQPGYCEENFIDVNNCQGPDKDKLKEDMSQDEVIHLLLGLSLVKKLCSDDSPYPTHKNYNLNSRSKDIACRMIHYIQNCEYNLLKLWIITRPSGSQVSQGSEAYFLSCGFVRSAKFFDCDNVSDSWIGGTAFWQTAIYSGIKGCRPYADIGIVGANSNYSKYAGKVYNGKMAAILGAISNNFDLEIKIKLFTFVGPTIIKIIIPQSTTKGIIRNTSCFEIESFYLLLWEVLHDANTSELKLNDVYSKIYAAPCEGPYRYSIDPPKYSTNGWASDNRWSSYPDEQNPAIRESEIAKLTEQEGDDILKDIDKNGGERGNFHGLDYMLYYNLYRLVTDQGVTGAKYLNYLDRYLTGNVNNPIEYDAVRSITSKQNIYSKPIIYRAGKYIDLKPGFNAKATENNFHAYIAKVNGCIDTYDSHDPIKKSFHINTSVNKSDIIDTIPCIFDENNNLYDSLSLEVPSSNPYTDTAYVKKGKSISPEDSYLNSSLEAFRYVWDFGNGHKAYTRTAKTVYTKPGIYNIQLVIKNKELDVEDTLRFKLYKQDCEQKRNLSNKRIDKDLQYLLEMKISITPNPNKGDMKVKYSIPEIDTGELIIYNVYGKELLSYQLYGWQNSFDISATSTFEQGIYYYKAIIDNKQFGSGKIVIVK